MGDCYVSGELIRWVDDGPTAVYFRSLLVLDAGAHRDGTTHGDVPEARRLLGGQRLALGYAHAADGATGAGDPDRCLCRLAVAYAVQHR